MKSSACRHTNQKHICEPPGHPALPYRKKTLQIDPGSAIVPEKIGSARWARRAQFEAPPRPSQDKDMLWWLNERGATFPEKFSLGFGPNLSGPLTGAYRTVLWLEGPLISFEVATQSADQSQVSPGPQMTRHLGGGRLFQVTLGIHTFGRSCNTVSTDRSEQIRLQNTLENWLRILRVVVKK